VAGSVLASVPVNAEAGSYMTFAFPVILFCIVAAILYLQFSRPHRRVPPRRVLAPSRAAGSADAGNVSGAPSAESNGRDETTEASE
jgi:hypothetical protein